MRSRWGIAVCVLAATLAGVAVRAEDDWQYWNEMKIEHGLAEGLDVGVVVEQNF